MNGLTEMLLVSRSGPLQARPSEYGSQFMLVINEAFQATFLSLAVLNELNNLVVPRSLAVSLGAIRFG